MVKGVKNEAFGVDSLSNVNSVIALGCIHSMNKKKKKQYARVPQELEKLRLFSYSHITFYQKALCFWYLLQITMLSMSMLSSSWSTLQAEVRACKAYTV